MAMSSFGCLRDRETYYAGFSWHSTDARIMKDAGGIFAAARTQGGRTSVDWEGFLPVTNGFFFPWKDPATFNAGYLWFARKVGCLSDGPAQTKDWFVVPHLVRYEESEWLRALAQFDEPQANEDASMNAGEHSASRERVKTLVPGLEFGQPIDEDYWQRQSLFLKSFVGNSVWMRGTEYLQLGKAIGQGTFGTVHRAKTNPKVQPPIVVKKANPETQDLAGVLAEAAVLCACIGHPHIAQVLDLVQLKEAHDRWSHGIVLEEWGTDLQESLPRFQKNAYYTRQILSQLADGLSHLHRLGAIHSDVKPRNVLVKMASHVGNGRVKNVHAKLADFGSCVATNPLHRIKYSDQRLRASGVPLATLPYRAPELICGMQEFSAKVVCFLMFFVGRSESPKPRGRSAVQGRDLRTTFRYGAPSPSNMD